MKRKTKKAAAKRYKVTANGRVKIKRAGLRHILKNRSRRNKRPLNKGGYVCDADVVHVHSTLPYGSR